MSQDTKDVNSQGLHDWTRSLILIFCVHIAHNIFHVVVAAMS